MDGVGPKKSKANLPQRSRQRGTFSLQNASTFIHKELIDELEQTNHKAVKMILDIECQSAGAQVLGVGQQQIQREAGIDGGWG